MLSVNDFPIIKEIQSLSTQRLELAHNIEQELKRVQKLKDLKAENINRKKELDSQLVKMNMQTRHMENEANKKTLTLTRKREQLLLVISDKQLESIKNEISNLELTIESIELEALELLEEIDPLTDEQQTLTEFFTNIDASILEIDKEVSSENLKLQLQIQTLKERILLLIEELSPTAKTKVQHVMKSKLIPFLTTLKNQSCSNCGMGMPSENMTHILSMTKLISCSGCSRLIIE